MGYFKSVVIPLVTIAVFQQYFACGLLLLEWQVTWLVVKCDEPADQATSTLSDRILASSTIETLTFHRHFLCQVSCRSSGLKCSLNFPVFVDAVRCQCDGNNVNLQAATDGVYRILHSPNYGNEYGTWTFNSSWTISLPSPNHFVIVYVGDLRLHYRDGQNNIHCMPSYDFRINGGILTAQV